MEAFGALISLTKPNGVYIRAELVRSAELANVKLPDDARSEHYIVALLKKSHNTYFLTGILHGMEDECKSLFHNKKSNIFESS